MLNPRDPQQQCGGGLVGHSIFTIYCSTHFVCVTNTSVTDMTKKIATHLQIVVNSFLAKWVLLQIVVNSFFGQVGLDEEADCELGGADRSLRKGCGRQGRFCV